MNLDDLTDEQKANVMELIILTVKEIREQIAADILGTAELWKAHGHLKSRKTKKAFLIAAAIARGEHERGLTSSRNSTQDGESSN